MASAALVLGACAGDDSGSGVDGSVIAAADAGADAGLRDGGDVGRADAGAPRDGGGRGGADSGSRDAGPRDAGTIDSGPYDGGPHDGGPRDAGTTDSGSYDGGPHDGGPRDAGTFDSGPYDGGPHDSGPRDAGTTDSGTPRDGGAAPDAGAVDAGIAACPVPSPLFPYGSYSIQTYSDSFCSDASCTQICAPSTLTAGGTIHLTPFGSMGRIWVELVPNSPIPTGGIWLGTPVWLSSTLVSLEVSTADCLFTGAPNAGDGTILIDIAQQSIHLDLDCYSTYPNPGCSNPVESVTSTMTGSYRCLPSATRCVRGDVVTCDAMGTITSSAACGLPCP